MTRVWNPRDLDAAVDADERAMERYGIKAVTIFEDGYPPLLRELHDPPFVLFWRGALPDPEKPVVAIVGTRTPTGTGALAAARFGRDFAEAGITVVSGLARGIDAFAHRGCVDAGGITLATLACGLDRIYPRSNATLAAHIVEGGGALIGEYPPGEEPLKYRFPERNRIIAGLARSVLVVEAPEKSGALITADFALEGGRDLFVHALSLDSPRGAGTARLADEGAEAVSCAGDILASWGIAHEPGDGTIAGSAVRASPIEAKAFAPPAGRSLNRDPEAYGRQLALEFEKELDLQRMKRPLRRTEYGLQEGSN